MLKRRKNLLARGISRFADIVEMVISIVLIVSIIYLLVDTAIELYQIMRVGGTYDFNELLERLFNLIIGVEFTRMMCQHTPNTIIEVLMFATARQLVINHNGSLDSLLGVAAVALLFVIRKYFMPSPKQEDDSGFIFRNPYPLRWRKARDRAARREEEKAILENENNQSDSE